jgi:hypothetical protein
VVATGGDGLASVSFSPPASDGGSPILSFKVTSSPGGLSATGASSPIVVTGLTNGVLYFFTVTATNDAGEGPPSVLSNSVVPAGLPGAPTDVSAIAGDRQAVVLFTPPASDGGSAVIFYTATASPGPRTAVSGGSPIIVPGLINGTSYTFTVTTTTIVGTGPASAPSNPVVPDRPRPDTNPPDASPRPAVPGVAVAPGPRPPRPTR